MDQYGFTLVTKIDNESVNKLTDILTPIGDDIQNNPHIKFSDYTALHYCCFVIVTDTPPEHLAGNGSVADPVLVFEGNVDGDVQSFLQSMIEKNRTLLQTIYDYCIGCPDASTSDSEFLSFLMGNDLGSGAYYVAHPGRTRNLIEKEQKLRDRIEVFITNNRSTLIGLRANDVRDKIRSDISDSNADMGWVRDHVCLPIRTWLGGVVFKGVAFMLVAAAIVIGLSALGIISAEISQYIARGFFGLMGAYFLWLRRVESADEQAKTSWKIDRNQDLVKREGRRQQSHLTSVTYIKPGWLRELTLRVLLKVVGFSAHWSATKGNLSGIVTIHFARWVILDGAPGGPKRLLFFSNYDGSWENYLGEFIDHASVGLTAIWSNTELGKGKGFPDTKCLVFGGARDEQRFKTFARNSQRAEQIWYSAYHNISVRNVGNNKGIRDGLFANDDAQPWLRRL